MKTIKKSLPYAITGVLLPLFAFAQNPGQIGNVVINIQGILNSIIPVLLIIGTIVFLWGVISFVTAGADEEKRANARQLMIYGLVALFVMVAVWGIVRVLVQFFGVGGQGVPTNVGTIQ